MNLRIEFPSHKKGISFLVFLALQNAFSWFLFFGLVCPGPVSLTVHPPPPPRKFVAPVLSLLSWFYSAYLGSFPVGMTEVFSLLCPFVPSCRVSILSGLSGRGFSCPPMTHIFYGGFQPRPPRFPCRYLLFCADRNSRLLIFFPFRVSASKVPCGRCLYHL